LTSSTSYAASGAAFWSVERPLANDQPIEPGLRAVGIADAIAGEIMRHTGEVALDGFGASR